MPKEDLIDTKPVDLAKILQEYHDFLKKLNEQEKDKEPLREKKKSGGSAGTLMDKSLNIQPKELRNLIKKIRVNLESGGNPTNKKEELDYSQNNFDFNEITKIEFKNVFFYPKSLP